MFIVASRFLRDTAEAEDAMQEAFVKAFAPGLSDNGAMTSLNLSNNELGAEGAEHIAAGIKVTKCAIAVVLAPFSRVSI